VLVRWTKPSANDLTSICDFTEKHFGPKQARRIALAIWDTAESLSKMPHRGRKGRKPNTREIDVSGSPFVVVYNVGESAV
jgi:toxin ParE1/3/4